MISCPLFYNSDMFLIRHGDGVLLEIFVIDSDDLCDLMITLKRILRIINSKNEFIIGNHTSGVKCISTKGLIRYEKHSRYYRFVYDGDRVVIMDSRTARERISSIDMRGFIVVNPVDVINVGRVRYYDTKQLYMRNSDKAITVSRRNRALLEKTMDIVYNH